MKELDVIDRFRRAFPGCGIGDDAAVLPGVEGDLLFAADAAIEGVHFDRRFCTLSQAVQKLVTSNVSDIFAMGGRAGSIVFTAGLPEGCAARDVDDIIDGLTRSCTQYGVKLVGGDTVLSPRVFVFNVAITGEVNPGRAVLRSGARVGDAIVLFGEIGRSLAGLGILSALSGREGTGNVPVPRAPGLPESAATMKKMLGALSLATAGPELDRMTLALGGFPRAHEVMRFVQHHLVPLAYPLDASILEAEPPRVTAMIDVSDGLAKDLRTLCEESGVGAILREDVLPMPEGMGEIFGLEGSALVDFAISSGEEYVLLATVASEALKGPGASQGEERFGAGAAVIGTVVPASEGVVLVDAKGRTRPIPKLGYEHSF